MCTAKPPRDSMPQRPVVRVTGRPRSWSTGAYGPMPAAAAAASGGASGAVGSLRARETDEGRGCRASRGACAGDVVVPSGRRAWPPAIRSSARSSGPSQRACNVGGRPSLHAARARVPVAQRPAAAAAVPCARAPRGRGRFHVLRAHGVRRRCEASGSDPLPCLVRQGLQLGLARVERGLVLASGSCGHALLELALDVSLLRRHDRRKGIQLRACDHLSQATHCRLPAPGSLARSLARL